MDNTIAYYNQNAHSFIAGTVNADMSRARDLFLQYVKPDGRILDLKLEKSEDLKDTFLFSGKLQANSKKYVVHLNKNTSIIVQMTDGTVAEYEFKSFAMLSDYWVDNGRPLDLPEIQIFTDSADKVAYIKLSKAAVCDGIKLFEDYFPGIEFELYKAE